jgi:hypothetical protein
MVRAAVAANNAPTRRRSHWFRAGLASVVLATVLSTAMPASAYDRPLLLERVASYFAQRPAELRCPSVEEWTSDPIWGSAAGPQGAWGYTDMPNDYTVLHPALCAGALAVSDPALPAWQRATGVLALVHEAYHLRRWTWRRSEARVECAAIAHFTSAAKQLGASPQLANDLLPYALAAHARMVTLFPIYRASHCRLPLWALPLSP